MIETESEWEARIAAELRWSAGLDHSLEQIGEQSRDGAAEMIKVIEDLSAGGQINAVAMLAAAIISTAAKDKADANGGFAAFCGMVSHQMQAHLKGLGKT